MKCFDAVLTDGGKYICPQCGQKEGGQLRIITHTWNCPYNRLPYCQDPRLAENREIIRVAPPPPADVTNIMFGDENKVNVQEKCWNHNGIYMGKLLETKFVGRMFDEDLEYTFDKGTLKGNNLKFTSVPCQYRGGSRRRRHHKRTRKHMKRRKQSTRKH